MALTVPTLALTSGIEIVNPLLVISELNINNNASSSERLEIVHTPDVGEQLNDGYKLVSNEYGGRGCTFMVSVFANKAAFDEGKPAVEQLREQRSVKVFSINLDDENYANISPREAAYTHLAAQANFESATIVDGLAV